jgi:hypothetical protein
MRRWEAHRTLFALTIRVDVIAEREKAIHCDIAMLM